MKRLRKMESLAVLAGVAWATAAAAQPEQWLEYHTTQTAMGYRRLELTTTPPPNVALPKLNAAPYFGRWVTPMDPSGGRWVCFDRTRKSGPYDRLFLDSNGNGRLDDETPLNAARRDEYSAYFDPVRLVFKGEDGPITYHLVLQYYQYQDSPASVLAGSGGWYEGTVNFAGKKQRVQLIDGNVNGAFNDIGSNLTGCDRIEVGEGEKAESRYLGRLLELDNQLFQIEVARDGAFLKVQEAENVVFGQVRVPETISEFAAVGEPGHFVRKQVKSELKLPVGKYSVAGWTINRKDSKGAAWTLRGYGFSEAAEFEVTAGKPAVPEIGEPVRGTLQVAEAKNSEVAFNLSFQGAGGERIEMMKGNERPRGPKLTLSSLDGSFRSTNSFEFG